MTHQVVSEGFGVRFRPVRLEDAEFIVWLRHLDRAKGKIHDSASDLQAQRQWLADYFQREGDYYFIIETSAGVPLGTDGFYNLVGRSAEAGRWIMRPGVPAAVPAAVVGLRLAFDILGFEEVRSRTVSTNLPALSLYRKMGFRVVRTETAAQVINGSPVDMVHSVIHAPEACEGCRRLEPAAQWAALRIARWEQTQLLGAQHHPALN